jgi:glutamate synthase domain-containing protein 2
MHFPIGSRFSALFICATLTLVGFAMLAGGMPHVGWIAWPALALTLLGVRDFLQTRHSIRRNYPILGNLRFFFEFIRPELRQYIVESDTEARPFSRNQRSVVYQRAKNELDKVPYGTELDLYAAGNEWITHSMVPAPVQPHDFRVQVGGARCGMPYAASLFNISAMSFGALSANAILALNRGALDGGFAHDTGEGGISRYHRAHGGDLIWEVGSGYFGCRTPQGRFDPARFADEARQPQVKMVEKSSCRRVPSRATAACCLRPRCRPRLRRRAACRRGLTASRQRPAASSRRRWAFCNSSRGCASCRAGSPWVLSCARGIRGSSLRLRKAMLATGITPDFIVVDGAEGGTGAAPAEFVDHMGMPMQEGLLLVHNTLVGLNLRERIRIGASGKVITAFDIARTLAIGADWCNS